MNWQKIATDMLKAGTKTRSRTGTGPRTRRSKKPAWWGIVALLIAAGSYLVKQFTGPAPSPVSTEEPSAASSSTVAADSLAAAIRNRGVEVPVESTGQVTRLLADDNDGSRHQRFILRVPGGQTVLIAHNIDLAPRAPVSVGDRVTFKGDYVWNDQGGVIHWTHHDPAARRVGGWVEVNGKRYE